MISDSSVGIYYADTKRYPNRNANKWFRPNCIYPEFCDFCTTDISSAENKTYDAVREMLHLYKLDEEYFGTPQWNPLKEIIKPGDYVLIKPNLVMDYNQSGEGTDCLFLQPSVLAPVLDYVILALKGQGHVTIGDAPMQECKFQKLLDESGYQEMLVFYRDILGETDISLSLVDFRGLTTDVVGRGSRHQTIRSDARGTIIDLGNESEFARYDEEHLEHMRITNYDPARLKSHHHAGKHEYYISEEVLSADVVINMPKPKSHRKAGFTAAMKNMVGINVRKEYLPHHTIESDSQPGDAHRKNNFMRRIDNSLYDKKNTYEGAGMYRRAKVLWYVASVIKILANHLYHDEPEGNWYGNRTISKTIVDLNKILLYADKKGVMQTTQQRRVLSIGDMIIAGQKEGPVAPSPKPLGVLAIAQNSFLFDVVIGTMMGADISRIPQLQDALAGNRKYSIIPQNLSNVDMIEDTEKTKEELNDLKRRVVVVSNCVDLDGITLDKVGGDRCWNIEPTSGWKEVFFGQLG